MTTEIHNDGFPETTPIVPTVMPQAGISEAVAPQILLSAEAIKSYEGSGMVVGEIGMKISRVPIEKYKASTQKTDRIAFINRQVIGVKFHYMETIGSIVCFGKQCCEMAGLPNARYLFPIVVYSTDNDGNLIGKKVDVRILCAGEDLYKSIITISKGLAQAFGGIDNADLLVTCTDDKYQKITLSPVGGASWKTVPYITQMVTERWEHDGENAYMALARKVDEAAFLKLVGLDGVSGVVSGQGQSVASNAGFGFANASTQDLSKFFND